MNVLVVYASRQGATQGIAERIVGRLRTAGCEAHARLVNAASDLEGYRAFVIGSGCYLGSWRPEATEYVRRHQAVLAERPTWLFSCGPLGCELSTAHSQDKRSVAEAHEIAEFRETIHPRDHQVFFGAQRPGQLGRGDPATGTGPADRVQLEQGDIRDWQQIVAWADWIACDLAEVPVGHAV